MLGQLHGRAAPGRALLAVPVVALALLVGACGGDDEQDAAPQQETSTATATETTNEQSESNQQNGSNGSENAKPAKAGIKISTGDSQFGEVLFDEDERAIYYFDKERTSTSECYGDCAVAWPPVLTDGEPGVSGGAKSGLLGTTKRDGGATQVTYDGRPLYYYVTDPPGQVFCHNVDEFGGLWLAVQPDGAPVP